MMRLRRKLTMSGKVELKVLAAVAALAVGVALLAGEPAPTYKADRLRWGEVKLGAGAMKGECGAVMGWFGGPQLQFRDADGKKVATLGIGGVFPSFDVLMADGSWLSFKRRISGTGEGDTFHLAFTWRPDGTCRCFVNGLSVENYFTASERTEWDMKNNLLDTVTAIVVDKGRSDKADSGWTDFRVYDRTVSCQEVKDAYRARMPFDFVCINSVFPADVASPISVTVGPGGMFCHPNSVDGERVTGQADFKLEVERVTVFREDKNNPNRVTRYECTPVAEKEFKDLAIDKETLLSTDPVSLPKGNYLARLKVSTKNGVYQRTREISVANPIDYTKQDATDDEWKKTKLLFEKNYRSAADMEYKDGKLGPAKSSAGEYLEMDGTPGQRMCDVLSIPEEYRGKPLLLEIDMPDDKPRSMGLYMYPEKLGGVRDRLGQGVQAGREFPSSGKMQTLRYPIFSAKTNFLIEARTMVNGWPAAIAAMRVYALDPAWPKLKLNPPEGLEGRRFGHVDEDQTFYNNLNADWDPSMGGELDWLVKYLNYTGQNSFVYSVLRYMKTYGATEGILSGNGMLPAIQGQLGYLIKTLNKNDISFNGRMAFTNPPEAAFYDKIDNSMRERGMLQLDREGRDRDLYNVGKFQANPANPEVWKLVLDNFDDIARHYGPNGLSAVAWGGFGGWHSLDYGYDDWTMNAFAKETATAFSISRHTATRTTTSSTSASPTPRSAS